MSSMPNEGGNTATTMMQYDAQKKSPLVPYLLWFFLGYLGVHRMFMGRIVSGILMAVLFVVSWVLTVVLIGFLGLLIWLVWWVADAFLLNKWITTYNSELAARLS